MMRGMGSFQPWLRKAGVTEITAVSFIDIVLASREVEEELREMIRLNPDRPEHVDRALSHLANMYAWLFTELDCHAAELRDAWPHLEQRLAAKERQALRRSKSAGGTAPPAP